MQLYYDNLTDNNESTNERTNKLEMLRKLKFEKTIFEMTKRKISNIAKEYKCLVCVI